MNPSADRLREIRKLVGIPLVLHGGTGIPGDQLQRAVGMGIAKINFSTVLRKAFIGGMQAHMTQKPDDLGLMDILADGRKAMKEKVCGCIDLCLCAGKN